jgi:predicted DNA-binding protein
VVKDKIIAIRVPIPEYEALRELADKQGTTLTGLIREAITSQTWRVELERNREYHRTVLGTLDEIEKRMKRSEKQRKKVLSP